MIRYHHILTFLLGTMLGSCKAPQPAASPSALSSPPSTPEAIEDLTVALVQHTDATTVRPYCAGVWVSPSVILTANHCVARFGAGLIEYLVRRDIYPSKKGYAENYPLVPRIGLVVGSDPEHDLALIRTPEAPPTHPSAKLRAIPVLVGSAVQTMGHSLGFWYSYSTAPIAAVRYTQLFDETHDPSLVIQSPIPISPGNSGGGLFDGNGELVGITHGTYVQGQGVNLFVHARYAKALLEGVSP